MVGTGEGGVNLGSALELVRRYLSSVSETERERPDYVAAYLAVDRLTGNRAEQRPDG